MTLLTLGEASRHSGLGVRTLKRAIDDKRLPAVRPDGWVYQIASDDVASFSLAYQVEHMASASGQRPFMAERPRAAVPTVLANPSGVRHWLRMLLTGLRPARGLPIRGGGGRS